MVTQNLPSTTQFTAQGSKIVARSRSRGKFSFTKKGLDKVPLPTNGQRAYFYDRNTRGLALAVTPKGKKTFILYRKVDGRPKRIFIGRYPEVTIEQARNSAAEKNAAIARGEDPAIMRRSGVPTFGELVEAYISQRVRMKANHPESAEYKIRWRLKRHFGDWLTRPVDKITTADVLAVKRECGEKKHLFNRACEFLRTLYNWSSKSRDGKINFFRCANPAAEVETYEEKNRKRFLQPDEVVRFKDELEKETHVDLRDFLTLAIETGARRTDILSMRWQDIRWEGLTWTVPYPKNGESYDVQLLPAALAVLERRRGAAPEDDLYVFSGVGRTGHLTDLKKPWGAFRKRAGIPDIRTHDLRRTVGSYAAMAGMSLQQIGAMLGHKSIQSTLPYAHLIADATRAARESASQKMEEMRLAAKKRQKSLAGKKGKLALVS